MVLPFFFLVVVFSLERGMVVAF